MKRPAKVVVTARMASELGPKKLKKPCKEWDMDEASLKNAHKFSMALIGEIVGSK